MKNLSTSGQDGRFANILRELQAMPNHMISNENEYRRKILVKYGVTEEELTIYIDSNTVSDLTLAGHTIHVRDEAHEFRADYLSEIKRSLSFCYNEEEELEFLKESDCNYSRWAYENPMWDRHQFKSFRQFAQWHIEQGGWKEDFQGLNFDNFAQAWALSWMGKWVSQKLTEIGTRRLKEEKHPSVNDADEQMNSDLRKNEVSIGEEIGNRLTHTENNHEVYQALSILPGSRKIIYEDLLKYVETNDGGESPDLRVLIFEGKKPTKPIVVSCQQNKLGAIFYNNESIPEKKAKALTNQLVDYFERIDDRNKIVKLKPSVLWRHLRGIDLPKE